MPLSTLQSDAASFLQRDDLTAQIPRFVEFATANFNRELRTPEMEARATSTADAEYEALPPDFLEVRTVTNGTREMRYLGAQQFAGLVASNAKPEVPVYTIEDFQLRVFPAPTPSSTLALTVLYYKRIPDLVGASDTNWLLDDHPDLYLWAVLFNARVWMHDDQRMVLVKSMYEQGLASLKRRKVHAAGISSAVGSDVPSSTSIFNINRGY